MLTKNDVKYYSSLLKKKNRQEEKKFLIEGKRLVGEGLNSSYKCEIVFVSSFFYETNPDFLKKLRDFHLKIEVVGNKDFEKLSDTENPQGIAAVFEIPQFEKKTHRTHLIIALEDISDPGNAGTIIRTCDWFGISEVILSENSVDLYNSKVIRASMGSVFHVKVNESPSFLNELRDLKKDNYEIICADMKGENIYGFRPSKKTVIVFSNEANGPSPSLLKLADKTVTIPRFGKAESLNVATASAIIISEFAKAGRH